MNEKISDDRLKKGLAYFSAFNDNDTVDMPAGELKAVWSELLSLRSLNKRLVEDGERLYKAIIHARIMFINIEVESDKKYAQDVDNSITAHCALMKEIGG